MRCDKKYELLRQDVQNKAANGEHQLELRNV